MVSGLEGVRGTLFPWKLMPCSERGEERPDVWAAGPAGSWCDVASVGGAFPSGGRVGPSSPEAVIPLVRVSLSMLFVSQLGDCRAVEEAVVQEMFTGQAGQALGTVRIKYLW